MSEVRYEYNSTLLHQAAYYNSTSCLSVLLRFAPHLVDGVDELNNDTPLMKAVWYDKRDAAKMLLRAGADVGMKNKWNETVLNMASELNNEEMLEILEQHQQVSGIF